MSDFDLFNSIFRLDPATGKLYWKMAPARNTRIGAEAGDQTQTGYWRVAVNGKRYKRSRVVWLLTHGEWPSKFIDHINRDKSDDRPTNLRDVSIKENGRNRSLSRNNTSGHLGVTWNSKANKWQTMRDGKYLGVYYSIETAIQAYNLGEKL